MKERLRLTDTNRRRGSYLRRDLAGDVLYSSYAHAGVQLRMTGEARVKDTLTAQMVQDGLITSAQKEACDALIDASFESPKAYDDWSMEEIGWHVQELRRDALGDEVIRKAQETAAWRGIDFDLSGGLDQRKLKEKVLARAEHVVFAIDDASYLAMMQADVQAALQAGKHVYVLYGRADMPARDLLEAWLGDEPVYLAMDAQGVDMHAALAEAIDNNAGCLMIYGEEGLLEARDLRLDAVVHAVPQGFYAQALVNQLGMERACVVYVPQHFDITRYVPLRERARLTYWQLCRLWEAVGEEIYRCSAEELYRRYPQYFINMYQQGTCCEEAAADCPLRVNVPAEGDAFAQHDSAREQAVAAYLNGFENFEFAARYFDKDMCEAALPYGRTQNDGILVHAVRVKKARQADVISCREGVSPRQMFAAGETGIISNFLFFMTPRLATLYNDLRSDRPREQADVTAGHLDYMLRYDGQERVETFPLFQKMCIAKKENGEFLFVNFRLGGGSVHVNGQTLRWEAQNVDVQMTEAPVCVYTPYLSLADGDADRESYRRLVGKGRVNLVILQDRIHCIRRGDVVLPSVGVVVSLREDCAERVLKGLQALEDGYYDTQALSLQVQLDAPSQIDPEEWQQVRWAYGGGLSLMMEGRGIYDEGKMAPWFEQEGWMSPLSRQTQESALHVLCKHPRTAIGRTKGGDMVLLVYSGRTRLSAGADYDEMCRIARQIFPDIESLMNVDGGASAVMCMVRNGVLMEVNCPSTSGSSCAGMVRPIKTMLYIPAE